MAPESGLCRPSGKNRYRGQPPVTNASTFDWQEFLIPQVKMMMGAGKTLIAAWRLEGVRLNPELLTKWIASNAPFLPKEDETLWRSATPRFNMVTQRVDIQLNFPWPGSPVD